MPSSPAQFFQNLKPRSNLSVKQALEAFETDGAQGTLVAVVSNGKVEWYWSTAPTFQVHDPWARGVK